MTTSNTLRFRGGKALLDAQTGAPIAFVAESNPKRRYLLDPQLPWHTVSHYWGTGHIVTDMGSDRWSAPTNKQTEDNEQILRFSMPRSGVELTVRRKGGDELTERYEWRNVTDHSIEIDDLAIQTPLNDRYPSGGRALTECVNAHVFAGGRWSWVLAVPMNGEHGNDADPCLGLIVDEGEVNAYSIESRNENTFSNVRGHIVLQPTDRSRNPEAFGGQPAITLAPGQSYTLSWRIGWYAGRDEFLAHTQPPARFRTYSATVNDAITVTTDATVIPADPELHVTRTATGVRLTAERPGTYHMRISDGADTSHTEVLFHLPLREQVRARAAYICRYQQAVDRPGSLAGAFVPLDTRIKLRMDDSGWPDWTDGSERLAMPILLQKAVNAGWLDDAEDVQSRIDAWAVFAKDHLIDATGATRRGSSQPEETFGTRIYDLPWHAEFFLDHYQATGNTDDLDLATRILERTSQIGGEHFLAISFAEVSERAITLLDETGRHDDAASLRDHVLASAEYFAGLGTNLPEHEVAYEQSIVAPLANLLITAHRLTGDARFLPQIEERLRWLLAFSGPQPDSRLWGIAIRHWDGYWFGMERQYGDVFPHYWSTLTATVLARLPRELRDGGTDDLAMAIMRANMANYGKDGSATCAFLFPSSIDGRKANHADPLANDQDWHLAIWLRLIAQEGFPKA